MGASLTLIGDREELVILPERYAVSMTYSNTRDVLAALGYEFGDDCVSAMLTLTDLWSSCNLYLSSDLPELVDQERETVVSGNVVACGRPEGYVTGRVIQIRNALEHAMLNLPKAKFCYFA